MVESRKNIEQGLTNIELRSEYLLLNSKIYPVKLKRSGIGIPCSEIILSRKKIINDEFDKKIFL